MFFDVDDTLSSEGRLTDRAYSALWALYRAGYVLVPVTGRPAGWCDHMARFWPVHAVVGENGAFVMMRAGSKLELTLQPGLSHGDRERIDSLKLEIRKEFPQAEFASDQPYRLFDVAVDFCEDTPPWQESEIERLLDFFRARSVHAKRSSIHVNAWYGDYDKCSGVDLCLEVLGRAGTSLSHTQILFIGDSPNDEPLFAHLTLSVGVANLAPYLSQLKSPPRWITRGSSGDGFVELASTLLGIMPD